MVAKLVLALAILAFALAPAWGEDASSPAAVPPPRPTTVFILLGGLLGADGYVDSAGMWELRAPLRKLGAAVQVYSWQHYDRVAAAIDALPANAKVVVVGYSGGGSRATWVMRMVGRAIDLMVLYDPSPAWQMNNPFTNRVKKAVCYYNVHPFIFDLGGGRCVGVQVTTIMINEPHLSVQFDRNLHGKTVAEVRRLMGTGQ